MKVAFFSSSFVRCAGLVALAVLATFPVWCRADREVGAVPGSAQAQQLDVRAQQFGQLWLARRKTQVAPQLVKMLADEPTLALRRNLVIALGRLEDPLAEKPLRQLLQRARNHPTLQRDQVEPFRIQLALGRINARNLTGRAKLDTVARSVGKNWASLQQDAKRLRVQLHDRVGIYEAQQSHDYFIVKEFYDVLYRMGKRGENIRALGAYDLVLWPQEKPLLFASELSDKEESRFWIKRASPPGEVGLYPEHLLDLGPQVPDELLEATKTALSTAKRDVSSVQNRKIVGLRSLFIADVATGDKRFLPLLRAFADVPDNDVRFYAAHAVRRLNQGQPLSSIAFP